MAIGYSESFSVLTKTTPFIKTKQKNSPRFSSLQMQYLQKKPFVVAISFFLVNTKKRKTIRCLIKTPNIRMPNLSNQQYVE
jgi:hypothetical protein